MVHISFNVLAGGLLFFLVRGLLRQDRTAGVIVAVGLLTRAVAGLALFWISYLHLPVASSLQIGDGLWFFALDGSYYLSVAVNLSEKGFWAILSAPREGASVSYVQVLSTFLLLFGRSAAVGVLLNLFSYVLTCRVIVWWGRQHASARRPALFALVALSLFPSALLWSLQPLKDTFFDFLVVAFIGAAVAWSQFWAGGLRSRWQPVVALTIMSVALYAIAGVRWYFAFAAFIAAVACFLLVAVQAASRKAVALAVSAVALFLLSRAFLLGAGLYVPSYVRAIMSPTRADAATLASPTPFVDSMVTARQGFVSAGGATSFVPLQTIPMGTTGADPKDASHGHMSLSQWLPGTVATFVPTSIQRLAGHGVVTGGRGLLWFADIDTVLFDVVLVVGLVWSALAWRRSLLSNSVYILVVLLSVFIAVPMIYTVTNFGTLFRLRGMVLVMVALLPLAAASCFSRSRAEDSQRG